MSKPTDDDRANVIALLTTLVDGRFATAIGAQSNEQARVQAAAMVESLKTLSEGGVALLVDVEVTLKRLRNGLAAMALLNGLLP